MRALLRRFRKRTANRSWPGLSAKKRFLTSPQSLFLVPLLLTSLWSSAPAVALVSFELAVGPKQYTTDDTAGDKLKVSATTLSASVHFDPIPLVPIAFGPVYSVSSLDESDYSPRPDSGASVWELGLEVKGWIPFVPVVTPYAKLRYVVKSVYDLDFKDSNLDATEDVSGYHLLFGVEYGVIPLLSAILELDAAVLRTESGGKNVDFNSQGFNVGLKIGF